MSVPKRFKTKIQTTKHLRSYRVLLKANSITNLTKNSYFIENTEIKKINTHMLRFLIKKA
jgi:hypothetical protein